MIEVGQIWVCGVIQARVRYVNFTQQILEVEYLDSINTGLFSPQYFLANFTRLGYYLDFFEAL